MNYWQLFAGESMPATNDDYANVINHRLLPPGDISPKIYHVTQLVNPPLHPETRYQIALESSRYCHQHIIIVNGYIIRWSIINGLPYLTICPKKDTEWDIIPHHTLSDDEDW